MPKLPVFFLLMVAATSQADDQRAELFKQAKSGDTAAQEQVWFSYSDWHSVYWNKARALFWQCRTALGGSELAVRAFEGDEKWPTTCQKTIAEGEKLGFDKYFPSGEFIGNVEFAGPDEEPMVVPSERIWKLTWTTAECEGVCQADLRINGIVYVGVDQATLVEGQMEFSGSHMESTIWLWPGTELTLLRPLARPSLQEFAQ